MAHKICRITAFLAVLLSTSATLLGAQTMVDRSRLDLRMGTRLDSRTSISPTGVVKTTGSGRLRASVGLVHWLREDLAVTTTATLLTANVEEGYSRGSGWRTDKAFAVPILVGLRHDLPGLSNESRWRPWGALEAGPIVGFDVTSSKRRSSTDGQTAVGARLALGARGVAGLDVRLGQKLMVSGSMGYLLIPGILDSPGGQGFHQGLDIGMTLGLMVK